jgi:O-antigen ligase
MSQAMHGTGKGTGLMKGCHMENEIMPNNYMKVNSLMTFLFCMYLSFSVFEDYINQLVGNLGKYFIFFVIICFFISYRNIKIKLQWYHLSVFLWLILKIVSIFWVSFNYIVQLHFKSQLGMVALFITMTLVDFDAKFCSAAVKTLLYTSCFMGCLCLFFSEPYEGNVYARQVLTLLGMQMDPNNQSAFLLIGIAISLYYLFHIKAHGINNLLLTGMIIINVYAVFMTGSRAGLLCVIVIAVISSLLVGKGKYLIPWKAVKYVTIVSLAGLGVYNLAKRFLIMETFTRVFDFSGYKGGSDRIDIGNNSIEIFKDNPFFGGGWGSYWGYNGYYNVVHNTYISVLTDGGIIGFILLFTPIIYISVKSLKQRYILPFLILVSGLGPSFFKNFN